MITGDNTLYKKAYELGQLDAEISECEATISSKKYEYTNTWRTETKNMLSYHISEYEKNLKKLLRKRARLVKLIVDTYGIPKENLKREK